MKEQGEVDYTCCLQLLKNRQKELKPGDPVILEIESMIQQGIEGDALGQNYGHAQYFLDHPEEKAERLERLKDKIRLHLGHLPTVSTDEEKE